MTRWFLALASRLVPKGLRPDWRAEWEAELQHREASLQAWRGTGRGHRFDLGRRAAGAIWDALWIRSTRWHALRLFGRHWRLALAAVLSLSAALGATTIAFAIFDVALLRPPGIGHPASLQLIHGATAAEPYGPVSYDEFAAYRARSQAFSDVAAFPYSMSTATISVGDRDEPALLTQVSDTYFPVLGIAPRLGSLTVRALPDANEDAIVIGEKLWHRLGADPGIVGATVKLNGTSVVVAGVAPQAYAGMLLGFEVNVFMSLKTAERVSGSDPALLRDRTQRWLHMAGRLRPGVTRAQAATEVALIAAQLAAEHQDTDRGRSATVTDMSFTPPGDRRWTATLLGGLVFIVLLALVVAGANVTNLLLGLATSRRHEMLIRAALGGSRLQLIAPLLREGAALGALSGLLGFGIAVAILRRIATLTLPFGGFPSPTVDVRPDAVIFIVTLLVAAVAGVAVALAPALRVTSAELGSDLNRSAGTGERRRFALSHVLVLIQMAVATVVMVGVGLSLRSFQRLEHVPLGFSARHLIYAGVDLDHSGYDEPAGRQFYARLRSRMSQVPGIEAVALASNGPLMGFPQQPVFSDEGGLPSPGDEGMSTSYAVVDTAYFSTIGMPLLAGRPFDSRDRVGAEEVAVVNATMAHRLWADRDAVGRHLRVGKERRLVRVIGLAPDSRYDDVTESPEAFLYLAQEQHYLGSMTAILRPRADVSFAHLHFGTHDLDGDPLGQAIVDIATPNLHWNMGFSLDDLLQMSLLLPKIIVVTCAVFGALALALALFGLYGTVFHAVAQRQAEMGIRVALGAQPVDIFRTVLGRTAWVAFVGAAIGVAAGQALLPVAASIFYGIGTVEPAVLIGVALTSSVLALCTTYAVARPWTRRTVVDLLRR